MILEKKKAKKLPKKLKTIHRDATGKIIKIHDVITVICNNNLSKGIVTRYSQSSIFFRVLKGMNTTHEHYVYNNSRWVLHRHDFVGEERYCTKPGKKIKIIR